MERDSRGITLRVGGFTFGKLQGKFEEREGVVRTGDPQAELFEVLAPGGLSNFWSCAVPRFSPEDFADAARVGEEQTWPLGYEDLVPWYEKVEPLLHIAGPAEGHTQLPAGKVLKRRVLDEDWSALVGRARQQGRAVTAMPYAYGAATTFTPSGTPFNSFVRLVKPELARGKIRVAFGARAASLEWSSARRRVQAVVFRDRKSGREERVTCRAVVVAGGALNSAQVLLESQSSDFPRGLGEGHANIGRYLHDHPIGKVVIDLKRPMSILPPAYITRLELARAKRPLYASACMQWSSAKDVVKSALKGRPGRLSTVGFSVFGTMLPSADNYVAVDRSYRGRDGSAGLELHIRYAPEVGVVVDEARDHLLSLLAEADFGPKISVWKFEAVGSSNHYAGTCRMHQSPKYGVVDAFSRIHGVPNVIVADSSVFTTNPEKNPVLTSMSLAARAASKLADDLNSGDL